MDITPYLANLRRMDEDAREASLARAREARRRLPELVSVLVMLGARRVVLFGSLLQGELHDRSDIDVAVEGLPAGKYWEALWRCSEAVGRNVDLVPLEDATGSLLARVEAEGEVLHG